jgi:hypothetical protein
MTKTITTLIIASAALWLALPAAAQFEIDPDHFGDPAPTVLQPRPKQSKGSMKSSLPYKQVQKHQIEAVRGTKNPANTLRTSSSTAVVQHRRVSDTSLVARGHADREAIKQSGLAPSHRLFGWVPQ